MKTFKSIISGVIYNNQDDLLHNKYKKDQDNFIIEAIFATGFLVLTGGAFLTGFALYLGATDTMAGYIPLLGSICGIFSIFAGLILERISKRKKLVLITNIISKTMIALVVAIPSFIKGNTAIVLFFIILAIAYIINSFRSLAINNWFISVVPDNIRGRYFAIRQTFSLIIAAILPVLAGRFLDVLTSEYIGFVVIFSIAFILLIGENKALSKISEPESGNLGKGNIKLKDIILVPLKNKKFMKYTSTMVWFYLGFFIAAAYTQVYMIKYLGLSYTFITLMGAGICTIQIAAYRFWGGIYDKKGAEFTMKTAIWIHMFELIAWFFVSDSTKFIFIPIAFFLASIATPGFITGSFNLRYKLMPDKGRTLYDGFFTAVIGLVIIIGPLLGRVLQNGITAINIEDSFQFAQFRILYAIAALVLMSLQIYNIISKRRQRKNKVTYITKRKKPRRKILKRRKVVA